MAAEVKLVSAVNQSNENIDVVIRVRFWEANANQDINILIRLCRYQASRKTILLR